MSDVADDTFMDDETDPAPVTGGDSFRDFVRGNPAASVIGAFIAGVILARIGLV